MDTEIDLIFKTAIHDAKMAMLRHVNGFFLGSSTTTIGEATEWKFTESPTQPSVRLDEIDRTGSLKAKRKGVKRDAGTLEELTNELYSFIVKNPGQRIEQIAKGMGVTSKELALPAKKLIAEKAVKTKGQRRATAYMPAAKAAR